MFLYYSNTHPDILSVMIKTVIFDFYGVFQVDPYAQWLSRNGLRREQKYDELAKQLDRGFITRLEFINHLSDTIGRPVTLEEIYAISSSIDQSVVDIASSLKSKYRIGLLSNASSALRSRLAEENLLHLFDEIVVSSEVGVAKPDSQIFKITLEKLESSAAETVFIDDSLYNIQAASELGIKSIHYIDPISLKESLSELGLNS